MNFLSLWMVCARVTLIWGVLRGGKGSIRPKVRFENSAYGQGLRLLSAQWNCRLPSPPQINSLSVRL